MPNTCVMILLDGLGDRAHAELGHRTPLQAAETPTLDRLAAMGSVGLYHAGKLGRPMPSENAHFAMFGSPRSEFPGRGPLEAMGAGVELGDDAIAMLAHFTCVLESLENQLIVKYDRICGTPDEINAYHEAVANYSKNGIAIDLHRTGGMSSVLTMRGDVSPHITDSNPMADGRFVSAVRPMASHADDPAAVRTAEALTEYLRWAYKRLCEVEQNKLRVRQTLPPINGLVTQRAGRLTRRATLRDRYGLCGLSMASGFMYKGLATFLGMEFLRMRDSRDPARDMAERVTIAAENIDRYDFIHIHHKAADRAAHTKSPRGKVKAIEALDRGLGEAIGPLLDNEDVLLVVTSDHSTPSCGPLIHSGEPVPVLFAGRGVRRDAVAVFDEVSVGGGALGLMRGDEMMHMILNYLDRARMEGTHDSPTRQEFWPGDFDPFLVGSKAG